MLPGLLDALEANRSDVFSYFGLANEDVFDYYLFDDDESIAGLCGEPNGCTVGRQIFASIPIHYHELIHAYLADAGSRPHLLEEGVATAITCMQDAGIGPVVPEWQDLFGDYHDLSADFYNSSMEFVRTLILEFGPTKFIDYYKHARFTNDAATFATDFNGYWSFPIDDIWAQSNVLTAQPICPCRADAISIGQNVQVFAHQYGGDYHPLAVPPASTISIGTSATTLSSIDINDCNRTFSPVGVATAGSESKTGLTIATLDASLRYIRFSEAGTDQLTVTDDSPLRSDCGQSGNISIGDDLGTLNIVVPNGGAPSFAHLSLSSKKLIGRARERIGAIKVCSDCSLSNCSPVPASPSTIEILPDSILEIDPGAIPPPGLSEFFMLVGSE